MCRNGMKNIYDIIEILKIQVLVHQFQSIVFFWEVKCSETHCQMHATQPWRVNVMLSPFPFPGLLGELGRGQGRSLALMKHGRNTDLACLDPIPNVSQFDPLRSKSH